MKMLIEKGADTNIKNKQRKTRMDLAMESGIQEANDLKMQKLSKN